MNHFGFEMANLAIFNGIHKKYLIKLRIFAHCKHQKDK